MKKIKLKITFDLLIIINELLSDSSIIYAKKSRNLMVSKSILVQISHKLLKKQLNRMASKKEFTLSLEFYEAHYLEAVLRLKLVFETDVFRINKIRSFTDQLNQQLV